MDILVANAGLPGSGLLEEFSTEELDRVLDVNLRAPIVLAHALAPAMAARGGGHLVFVSSLSGRRPRRARSCTTRQSSACAALRWRCASTCARSTWASRWSAPGFIRDAGMFADSGARLPPGVGTRTPRDVARAVAEAIEHNRAEVDVAPLALRAGTLVASVVPTLAASVTRVTGADRLADSFVASQRDKR